jgi:hypothetical protein
VADDAVAPGVNDRLVSFFLVSDDRGGEGVLAEAEPGDVPAGDEEDQSERRNERAGPGHQVKARHVERGEDHQGEEGEDEQGQKDLAGERLSLLNGRLEALLEESPVAAGEAGGGGDGADEDQADDDPGAPSVESARGEEEGEG